MFHLFKISKNRWEFLLSQSDRSPELTFLGSSPWAPWLRHPTSQSVKYTKACPVGRWSLVLLADFSKAFHRSENHVGSTWDNTNTTPRIYINIYILYYIYVFLVGGILVYLPLWKNDGVKVSWDDVPFPIWWENHNPVMFQTTNQLLAPCLKGLGPWDPQVPDIVSTDCFFHVPPKKL